MRKWLLVDTECRTGVAESACGDVTSVPYKQVVVAAERPGGPFRLSIPDRPALIAGFSGIFAYQERSEPFHPTVDPKLCRRVPEPAWCCNAESAWAMICGAGFPACLGVEPRGRLKPAYGTDLWSKNRCSTRRLSSSPTPFVIPVGFWPEIQTRAAVGLRSALS
jgi:hypothetical protein